MIQLDLQSRIPIYEQIVEEIKRLCYLNVLKPDEQLPSVRNLALELGINPNTVQKAFRQLEAEEVIHSVSGKGSFIVDSGLLAKKVQETVKQKLTEALKEAVRAGIEEPEIIQTVEGVYKGGGQK